MQDSNPKPQRRDMTPDSDKREDKREDSGSRTGSKISLNRRGSSRALLSFVRGLSKEVERPSFSTTKEAAKLHELMGTYLGYSEQELMVSIVKHLEFTLARTRFSINKVSCFNATALTVRDRLLEIWNDTQMHITNINPKRVYYMSIEYLMGRSLQNAILNMDIESEMKSALMQLGMKAEEVYETETDAALGYGGLGRLAACFLDSFATLNYPAWGYGIRYSFGIFRQKIVNGEQVEVPDYWLTHSNPWEIERFDVKYKVRFYGNVRKVIEEGVEVSTWENTETVIAMAYDTPILGYDTFNSVNLRLWKSMPSEEVDLAHFCTGNYHGSIEVKQRAEIISSVLYPNDSTPEGKELRLKQQYFFVSASVQDILRRFRKKNADWKQLQDKVAIQLNDTHPSLAIVELLRILMDEERHEFLEAWGIVGKVFSYTNHTVLPEALEKWGVDMLGKLLPRHLELIYLVNYHWMERVADLYPNNTAKMDALSIVEEGSVKRVRMTSLCILGSHKVNGVAQVHTEILKDHLFKDFYEMCPDRFTNVTNGITVRRWVHASNRDLSNFYTEQLASSEWILNYSSLQGLLDRAEDLDFQKQWQKIKNKNKKGVVNWVKQQFHLKISPTAMFDVMVKRIHEYKRQFMYCLYILHRYLALKRTSPSERPEFVERVFFMGGKAAPGYLLAKKIIKFAHRVMDLVNNDAETSRYVKFVFIPNYNVSKAELFIPATDLTEQISTAGTEASGTSNMKFAMNGALIMGTMDGANIEIAEEVGEENMLIFGKRVYEVDEARQKVRLADG